MARTLGERLSLLTPETEVALLLEAGLENVELFYSALTFRVPVARA